MGKKSKNGQFGPQGEERMRSQDYSVGLIQAGEPISRKSQKVFRVAAWALIIAFTLTNVSNCSQQIKTHETQTILDTQVKDTYNPAFKVRYQEVGQQVIDSWYKGTPPPINITSGVQWPSNVIPVDVADAPVATNATAGKGQLRVTNIAFLNGTQKTGESQSFYQERLNYYALVNGVPQQISLTVGVPDTAKIDNYPILIAPPTILPYKAPGISNLQVKPVGQEAKLSKDSETLIESWASAYTTNDSVGIKQTTGDSKANNAYTGLGSGWKYVPGSATVVWSVIDTTDIEMAIARISWTMKAPDVMPAVTATNANPVPIVGASQIQTMDILVSKFASGSPTIQAWGPVGTYLDLKPFQNAIDLKNNKNDTLNPENNKEEPVVSDPKSDDKTTAP